MTATKSEFEAMLMQIMTDGLADYRVRSRFRLASIRLLKSLPRTIWLSTASWRKTKAGPSSTSK